MDCGVSATITKHNRALYCKPCGLVRKRAQRQAYADLPTTKARQARNVMRWRLQNPEKARAIVRRHYAAHPGRAKGNELRREYDVSTVWYLSHYEGQGGKCAICRQPFEGQPCVDHDHETGKARGLLCRECNFVAGSDASQIIKLQSAVAYLKGQL